MITTASAFTPKSWKRNRSKYKVLKLLERAKPDTVADFEYLYVNSGVPHATLAIGLKKWRAWRYITGNDVKGYRILNPGRLLIKKLATKICPHAVKEWDAELREWLNMLPPITSWARADLKRLIEPLMYHRPATHPGKRTAGGVAWRTSDGKQYWVVRAPGLKNPEKMTFEEYKALKQEGGEWISFTYGDHAAGVMAGSQTTDGKKLKKPISRKRALKLVESTDYIHSGSAGAAPDPGK